MSVNEATIYRGASFALAAARCSQLPADSGFEVAFAGRSNAGKSSALNALTGQRRLARTSKTPGRTQQIVVFELDWQRRLIDLPGYGYAKVSKSVQRDWYVLLEEYFNRRRCLRGLVLIMDIRHPLKPGDAQMLEWCQAKALPCYVLLTKADKLKRGPSLEVRRRLLKEMQGRGLTAEVEIFSAVSGQGVGPLCQRLDLWLELQARSD